MPTYIRHATPEQTLQSLEELSQTDPHEVTVAYFQDAQNKPLFQMRASAKNMLDFTVFFATWRIKKVYQIASMPGKGIPVIRTEIPSEDGLENFLASLPAGQICSALIREVDHTDTPIRAYTFYGPKERLCKQKSPQ